jgi:hypothetical protein
VIAQGQVGPRALTREPLVNALSVQRERHGHHSLCGHLVGIG